VRGSFIVEMKTLRLAGENIVVARSGGPNAGVQKSK
jgi:hypothetical protein